MRAGNQIAAFNELRTALESSHLTEAHLYVVTQLARDLEDPQFRYAIAHRESRTPEAQTAIKKLLVFNQFFETIGLLMKMDLVSNSIFRRTQHVDSWLNFEYAAVLAEGWIAAHPQGDYPKNVRRFPISDPWVEADRQYSEAPAAK